MQIVFLWVMLLSSASRGVQDPSSALIAAVVDGAVADTRSILESGADANARNSDGATALILAAAAGHRDVAAALIAAGADVNLPSLDGTSALAAASKNGYTDIVRDLLEEGADANASNQMGVTVLMVAARQGKPETIEALVDSGADVNARTERGANALRIATTENHLEATMLLLRAGAQTDDIEGRKTPLTEAIREQRDEAAVLLLASSDEELTAYALVVAARDGSSNIFEILASPENQRSQRLSERAVHIRAGMGSPNKIKDVAPRYPDEAKDKRIQGIVILEAIIDAEGNVTHVRVLRSIPALDQAAIDAVKQWKYEPTLMDGVPVPIVMTVTVGFALT